MDDDALDPLIHVPTRLKIVATLAALPDGDTLSFTRLQDMIGLTPGNLIIHLRKLEEADYISSEKSRNGTVSITAVALTGHEVARRSAPIPKHCATCSAACKRGHRRVSAGSLKPAAQPALRSPRLAAAPGP